MDFSIFQSLNRSIAQSFNESMSFACLYVPDFPAAAILRAEPDLRGQAVAVLNGTPPLVKVFAANEQARKCGIEIGITKLQAEATPGIILRPRSPLEETSAHAALLDCAQSFSPNIEDNADDTVILDLEGLERLFGPVPQIAHNLARRSAELGLQINVAVASNPDAAMHAARGFPGVTVISPGKEEERLGDLPVSVLLATKTQQVDQHDPNEVLDTLDRWGVRDCRAVAALPQIALSERLGQFGVHLQRMARGATTRTLVLAQPPQKFEEALELEYPLALLEPLAFILNRLLEQLCARLSARALATNELRIRMQLDPAAAGDDNNPPQRQGKEFQVSSFQFQARARNPHARNPKLKTRNLKLETRNWCYERALHLPVPMLNPKTFLKLLQLELQAHPPQAPVLKIWLSAVPVRPRASQHGIFLPLTPEPEKLELTLARIASIVGEGRSGAVELLDTHRPCTFRMQRFASATPKYESLPAVVGRTDTTTALRMFRPPLRASVIMHAGAPVRIISAVQSEVRGEIVWSAGPWRAAGDWWKEETWSREEWDVALQNQTSAALYRMYRDTHSGDWFVEGSYD